MFSLVIPANDSSCHFDQGSLSFDQRFFLSFRPRPQAAWRNLKESKVYNKYYTYILSSNNNSTLYIGVTNDLERRISEHRSGSIPGFTQKYNCHKLVYFEEYSDIDQAIEREKQLKHWSRAKKDWLIDRVNPERKDLL